MLPAERYRLIWSLVTAFGVLLWFEVAQVEVLLGILLRRLCLIFHGGPSVIVVVLVGLFTSVYLKSGAKSRRKMIE